MPTRHGRKKSPAEPGLEKGECYMCLGLRLFTEELELPLGRADGPEGSALLAAFESGVVALGGYFSNDSRVNCGMRRSGIGFPPAFFGGNLDNFLDTKILVGIDQDHKGGGQTGNLFRLGRLFG